MQVLTRYKCEHCGEVYEDKAECEECEKNHPKPVRITGGSYRCTGRYPKYPEYIIVDMDDGSLWGYRIERLCSNYNGKGQRGQGGTP